MTPTIQNDKLNELFPTAMTFGDYKVELRNYRRNMGHDDSLPYQATLYINGKKVAEVTNDGWGGISNIRTLSDSGTKLYNEFYKFIKGHGKEYPAGEPLHGIQLYYDTTDFICDALAFNADTQKDARRHYKKRMVCYVPERQSVVTINFNGMGGATIPTLLEIHPQFQTLWEKTKKKYEDMGYIILNDYEYSRLAKTA